MLHALQHGTHPALFQKGENCPNAVLRNVDVAAIRALIATRRFTFRQISQWFEIGPRQISSINRGVTWAG